MFEEKATPARPQLRTYDSVHEHSLEHLLEVQSMVAAEADEEPQSVMKTYAAAAGF